MVTTDLGACEWFVWDLRRSNLIERGKLEQVVSEYLAKRPRAEPPELADYLVQQKIVTRFQADRLLAGKTQGFVLGPFTLMDALGTGSMGTVYKGQSKNDSQWYAVKVLPRRSMWNIRIARRKVRDFEKVDHPTVVPFKDVGTAGGQHYLVWPLVDGEPLDKFVERNGKLPPLLVAHYGFQAAEGLEACHGYDIIHGFLKPSNLLITTDHSVKILDFGVGCLLAEAENESIVDTMSTANTLASGLDCASPESIMDPKLGLTPASDQYSLGCTLFYCLTGRYPFVGKSAVEKMMAHQSKPIPSVREFAPDTPDDLAKIVERLMQKVPEARYGHISDVVAALKPIAVGTTPAALHGLRFKPVEQSTRRLTPTPQSRPTPTPPPASIPTRTVPMPAVPSRGSQPPKALPTRGSLKAPAPPPGFVEPPAEEPAEPVAHSPHAWPSRANDDDYSASADDRVGPLGIAIAVIAAGLAAWLLFWMFKG